MPVKIDTRKKTRKQKEKNRRRKKRNQSRKGLSLQRLSRSMNKASKPKNPGGSKSRRIRPSMQAIHGVVANAYASRMPIGSNHTMGIYANAETGLSSKNFFKRKSREMRREKNPG
jgi:hypothetical protein